MVKYKNPWFKPFRCKRIISKNYKSDVEEINMPFKSKAQRKYLYANDPEVAEEFAKETPKGKKLPEKVKKKNKNKK